MLPELTVCQTELLYIILYKLTNSYLTRKLKNCRKNMQSKYINVVVPKQKQTELSFVTVVVEAVTSKQVFLIIYFRCMKIQNGHLETTSTQVVWDSLPPKTQPIHSMVKYFTQELQWCHIYDHYSSTGRLPLLSVFVFHIASLLRNTSWTYMSRLLSSYEHLSV